MERHILLDEKVKRLTKQYKVIESELLDTLIELRKIDGFRKLGCKGAFEYLTRLGYSRDIAYTFMRVSEKCQEVPKLKEAIKEEKINVSTARRILSVVSIENSKNWIEKATSLPQQALEKEVAKINPKALLPERTRVITEHLVENRYPATFEEEELIKRVMDLESQRQRKNITRQEAIKVMALLYLEKNDPIEKAKRAKIKLALVQPKKVAAKSITSKRTAIPAHVLHEVNLRDKGKCIECDQARWADKHHLIEVKNGGKNEIENLITLCHFHHRQRHLNPYRLIKKVQTP